VTVGKGRYSLPFRPARVHGVQSPMEKVQQLGCGQPWPPPMDHPVAVGAEKSQISHLRSCAWVQMRDGHGMVTLDVAIPKVPVTILEVEPANLAGQVPVLADRDADNLLADPEDPR